jgi:hypothetical protein
MSEISNQLDLFRDGPMMMVAEINYRGRSSPIGQATAVSGHGEHHLQVPFILSPLNENDEDYNDPLN